MITDTLHGIALQNKHFVFVVVFLVVLLSLSLLLVLVAMLVCWLTDKTSQERVQ